MNNQIKNNIEIIKNSLDLYSYNGKDYKTEAAAKKAKTMDTKRTIKENKKQAYHQKHGLEKIKAAVEQRKITKEINKNQGLPAFLGDYYQPSKSKTDKETRKENFLKYKGSVDDITEFRRYDRSALNGSFREIILEPEEPMNKETQHLIRYLENKFFEDDLNKGAINQLIEMYYSNSISYLSDIISKEIIKTYIKFNDNEGDKYNLSVNLIFSYEVISSEGKSDATIIGGRLYNYYDYDVKGDFDDKKKIIKKNLIVISQENYMVLT